MTCSETEDGQNSFNGRDAMTGDEKSGLKEVIIYYRPSRTNVRIIIFRKLQTKQKFLWLTQRMRTGSRFLLMMLNMDREEQIREHQVVKT